MIPSNALVLSPASAAFGALVELSSRAGACPDAQSVLELARGLVPLRTPARRRRRISVPAGRIVEVLPGTRRGSPLLEPAPGSLPAFDEERQGVSIYRVQASGTIEGRVLGEGERLVVARRHAARGEWVLVAAGRSLCLQVAGRQGRIDLEEGGRVVGVVEAVVGEGARRRCA